MYRLNMIRILIEIVVIRIKIERLNAKFKTFQFVESSTMS